MNITEKDLIGEIKDFPIEVVEKMIERQVEQGNKADVRVFQKTCLASRSEGGFSWYDTIEGWEFWNEVILDKNFDLFFAKYPKAEEEDYWVDPDGRRMLVWDYDEDDAKEIIVIAKLPLTKVGQYMAVNDLDTGEFKRGENYDFVFWEHAKPIPQKTKLSLSSIAEKFGLKPDEIEIDFDK